MVLLTVDILKADNKVVPFRNLLLCEAHIFSIGVITKLSHGAYFCFYRKSVTLNMVPALAPLVVCNICVLVDVCG